MTIGKKDMIPVVKKLENQFFRKALWNNKATFITYKDIVPAMQIITPKESFSTIDIAIYTTNDVLVQSVTHDVVIEDYTELEQIVIHKQTELSIELADDSYFYLKITAGSNVYYSESFRTMNIDKYIDPRITQDDDDRSTQDSERRITNG